MITAFVIGLASVLHCLGMCGSLVGAMTMSLPAAVRQHQGQLFLYTLAYNTGRVFSYVLAGLLMGALGEVLKQWLLPLSGATLLRLIAAMMVIALGLHLGGWAPRMAWIESLGRPLWKHLQPVGQRLLPVRSLGHAFVFGMIWGWLPCGMVYYALLMAPAQDGLIDSALFMAAFGLGTLLPMVTSGFLLGKMEGLRRSRWLRQFSGLVLIALGIATLMILLGG